MVLGVEMDKRNVGRKCVGVSMDAGIVILYVEKKQ